MRTVIAIVCGAVAVLASLATIPTAWVATHVASEDGYVAFSEPFATDTEFRETVSDFLSEQILARTGAPAKVRPAVAAAISTTVARVSRGEGWTEAWTETQRRSHQLMFGDLRDLPAEQDSTDRFAVDLAPLADYVVDEVGVKLPVTLKVPEQLVVSVNGAPERRILDRVDATRTQSLAGAAVVVIFVLLSLAFARRRSTALVGLGLGAVAVAGALKLIADAAVPKLLDQSSTPSPLAATLRDLLADRAVTSLEGWLVWIAVGGAVAVVLGLLGRVVTGRTSSPSAP